MSFARFSAAIVISHLLTLTAFAGNNPINRGNPNSQNSSGFGLDNQILWPLALDIGGAVNEALVPKSGEPIVVSTNAADASGRFGYAEGSGGGGSSSGGGISGSGPLGVSGDAGGGGGGSKSNPNQKSSQNTKTALNVSAAGSVQTSASASVAQVPEARDTNWLFALGLLGLGCYLIWLRKRSTRSTSSH